MSEILFYGGSVGAGLLLGWLFIGLWRRCTPPGTNRSFWRSLGDLTQRMLSVDDVSVLLSLYRRLAREVGGYLLRQVGGLVCACLPLVVFWLLVAPAALAYWDRRADGIARYPLPVYQEVVQTAERSQPLSTGFAITDMARKGESVEPVGRHAVCWVKIYCVIFELLSFRVIETSEVLSQAAPYLVIRAHHGDLNFLWPYVNDLEFAFWCAFMAITVGSLLWRRTI
jgi:hypothetical protein